MNDSNEELLKKISELENRISSLENRMNNLNPRPVNQQIYQQRPAINQVQQPKPTRHQIEQAKRAGRPLNQPVNQPINQSMNQSIPISQSIKRTERDSDFESFIGKNVFVILASVLIFIGIIVFASVLFPHLSEPMKFIMMVLASLLFTAFGYFAVLTKKNNFTVGLLACGLGTIYITLFTGNLYFKMISTIFLYIALILWILAVYYCSKYKSLLFNIIGQAGIIISLILCISDAILKQDQIFILYALIFVVIAEVLYDILFGIKGYIVNTVSMLISVLILSFPFVHRFEMSPFNSAVDFRKIFIGELSSSSGIQLIGFIVLCIMFGYVIVKNTIFAKKEKISTEKYAIINLVGLFTYFVILAEFEWSKVIGILMMLFCLIQFCITEWLFYSKERNDILNLYSCFLIGGFVILYYCVFRNTFIPSLVFAVPLLVYSYETKTSFNRRISLYVLLLNTVVGFIYILEKHAVFVIPSSLKDINVGTQWSNIGFYIASALISLFAYWYIGIREKEKNELTKMWLYLNTVCNTVLLLFIMNSNIGGFSYGWECFGRILNIFIAVVVQYLVWFGGLFDKRKELFGQSTFMAHFVVNAFVILVCFGTLYAVDKSFIAYIVASFITLVISVLNTTSLMKKPNNKMSAYIGIKITVLIAVIMHPINYQAALSIILFAWSVGCILIGALVKQKPLRVYGLVLAMISSVKLVMFDITYKSGLMRSFSLIICGLLCFLISYIYHAFEKKGNFDGVDTEEKVVVEETKKE